MKLSVFLIALLSIFTLNKGSEIHFKFAIDFLNHFNLNYGNIFFCGELPDINEWKIIMSDGGKYLSFIDLSSSKSDSWPVMRFEYQPIGIIFDVDCNKTENIFDEFSTQSYFNASYMWLMLSDDYDQSFELLSSQNINLDAEITLAVVNDGNATKLFDIYNPSARTNGELVVNAKGFWDESAGLNITLTGSKLDQRRNLNGVVIHTGIVSFKVENQTLEQHLEGKKILEINLRFNKI